MNIKVGAGNHKKLITTLNDKHNIVLHYKNVKQYLQLGMRLKKVHKVMCFRQSKWMKKYILMTTELRKLAKDEFMKTFAKLLINAVSYFKIIY